MCVCVCEFVLICGWSDRYDVLSQLPSSLTAVTAESDSLRRLMSGIKQLHVSGYMTSVDTRCLATNLLQFVFQVVVLYNTLCHTKRK